MQAILLCGGMGMRLRPLTETIPKPLLSVRGRPIIDYIVSLLDKHGVTELIVAAGYRSADFDAHFAGHPSVKVVDSGDVDIVKRLSVCAPFIRGDFLVLYGDTVSDVDVSALIDFHRSRSERVTVTAWPLRTQFGLMDLDDEGKVVSFLEKPKLDKWINIGHFCFSQDAISNFGDFERFEDFLSYLVERNELNAFRHDGVHITINTRKELEEAEDEIIRLGIGQHA